MSLEAITAVIKTSSSAGRQMCVMMILANWADQNGFVIYRNKTQRTLGAIARDAHTTPRTVSETIVKMWEAGELWTESGGAGAGDINEYRLCLPGLETEEEKEAGVSFCDDWRSRQVRPQDMAPKAGTGKEPPQDVDGKLEETSSLDQGVDKVEVSSDKLEETSGKVEVSSASIERPSLPLTTPLTPQTRSGGIAAGAASQPDGLAAPPRAGEPPPNPDPAARPKAPYLDPLGRFLASLRARCGQARFDSWFADLKIEQHSDDAVVLSTPGAPKRDIIDTRFGPDLESCWREANGPAAVTLVARKPEPRPVYSVDDADGKAGTGGAGTARAGRKKSKRKRRAA